MRKIIFTLSLLFIFSGCSVDDEPTPRLVYELVPIVSTNLPEEFTAGESYDLKFTYQLPTPCHNFTGINVEDINGAYGIGVVAYYDANNECAEVTRTAEAGIKFIAEEEDFYIFKFWQGRNEQGEDQFLTVEIPVITNSS